MDRFLRISFGLPKDYVEGGLGRIHELISEISGNSGKTYSREEILTGFYDIANELMAGAIRSISIARGYDPADYTMLAFGGAGGMHACRIAGLLGMRSVLVPADAGLLSAYGLANALIERFAEKGVLKSYHEVYDDLIQEGAFEALESQVWDLIVEMS